MVWVRSQEVLVRVGEAEKREGHCKGVLSRVPQWAVGLGSTRTSWETNTMPSKTVPWKTGNWSSYSLAPVPTGGEFPPGTVCSGEPACKSLEQTAERCLLACLRWDHVGWGRSNPLGSLQWTFSCHVGGKPWWWPWSTRGICSVRWWILWLQVAKRMKS